MERWENSPVFAASLSNKCASDDFPMHGSSQLTWRIHVTYLSMKVQWRSLWWLISSVNLMRSRILWVLGLWAYLGGIICSWLIGIENPVPRVTPFLGLGSCIILKGESEPSTNSHSLVALWFLIEYATWLAVYATADVTSSPGLSVSPNNLFLT